MHTIIVGQTGSGKTYFAKNLIKKHLDNGINVVIYNPTKEAFEKHDLLKSFATAEGFYDYLTNLKNTQKIMVYIDEAATLVDEGGDKTFNTFMTTARHLGWVTLSTQRPVKVVTPTIVSQCSNFIVFKIVYQRDIKLIAGTLNVDEKVIKGIPKHQYFNKKMIA